ncbi:MAG: sugar phosphate isomerase/epimerase family protein [Thermoguttaceae bacterium]
MRTWHVVFMWLLAVMALLGERRIEAGTPAPKVYAYCVEVGVPKIQPRSPAELARLLREIGFDGGGYPILTGPLLDETLQANDAAGLQIYLLQTAINVAPKAKARYDDQVPAAIRKLKGRPVAVVVTINGLKPGDPAGTEPAVQALRELGNAAAEAGVRISLYNHVDCWNESVRFNIDLAKKVNHPQVGYNFNVCHWLKVEGNKDYRPLLKANPDKLFCVTLCGAQIGAKTWTNGLIQPLDQGDFDNQALLATLREIGYQGPVGVMCYGIPGDAREYLQRSMKIWKAWMAQP